MRQRKPPLKGTFENSRNSWPPQDLKNGEEEKDKEKEKEEVRRRRGEGTRDRHLKVASSSDIGVGRWGERSSNIVPRLRRRRKR